MVRYSGRVCALTTPGFLEVELHSKLKSTLLVAGRTRSSSNGAHIRIGNVRVWSSEIRMVENVKRVRTQLKVVALHKLDVLLQAHIPTLEVWATQHVVAGISVRGIAGRER